MDETNELCCEKIQKLVVKTYFCLLAILDPVKPNRAFLLVINIQTNNKFQTAIF